MKKYIDAFWLDSNRGMGRYAKIYSQVCNASFVFPNITRISNRKILYLYYILWEQLFFQLKHILISSKELVFAYNTPPLIKIGSYRCVLIIHDLIFFDEIGSSGSLSSKLLSIYRRFALIYGIGNVDKLVFVSDTTKKIFFERFKFNIDYDIVPNKVIMKKQVLSFNISRVNNNNMNLLFVTGKTSNKNIEGLNKLLKRIETENQTSSKKIHAHIIGINEKAIDINNPNITLYTNCSEETKNALFRSVDFFISISIQEGFGIPIIEAGINKTPIICSNIPVYREICDNYAIYVNPLSTEDIYKVIEELKNTNNPKLKKVINSNKEQMYLKCLSNYSLCEI